MVTGTAGKENLIRLAVAINYEIHALPFLACERVFGNIEIPLGFNHVARRLHSAEKIVEILFRHGSDGAKLWPVCCMSDVCDGIRPALCLLFEQLFNALRLRKRLL